MAILNDKWGKTILSLPDFINGTFIYRFLMVTETQIGRTNFKRELQFTFTKLYKSKNGGNMYVYENNELELIRENADFKILKSEDGKEYYVSKNPKITEV